MKTLTIIIIASILLAGAFFVFRSMTGNVVGLDGGEDFRIPLSDISKDANWYEYESSSGTTIKFFAVEAANGDIKTAFDECDVCFTQKRGYSQNGDFMVCNNCDNRYPITGLGTENIWGGGCWPGYLPSTIEGDYIVIRTSDLNKGEFRFK